MKTTDAVFLCSVALFAAVFVVQSVSYGRAEHALQPDAQHPVPASGGRGQARDVDIHRILRLIERGDLSSHEAEYYTPAPALSEKSPTEANHE